MAWMSMKERYTVTTCPGFWTEHNRLYGINRIQFCPLLTNSCVNRQLRRELRAFRRSEVSLSFELERVLDRNIGIGPPETGAVPMRISVQINNFF